MRELFSEYYRPTEDEFKKLWAECTFVFDANVLLNLYRWSGETRDDFFGILEKIKERIWLPHQVGYEFHKNRPAVILDRATVANTIVKDLRASKDKAIECLRKNRSPFVKEETCQKSLEEAFDAIIDSIESGKDSDKDLLGGDDILERIDNLFSGKVGHDGCEDAKTRAESEGKSRYEKEIPPGYQDNKKPTNKYGDLILWFQILSYSKAHSKSIVFVSDDAKEDWYLQYNGRKIGPRPELIREIKEESDANIWFYRIDQFMRYAKNYLVAEVSDRSIEEAKEDIDSGHTREINSFFRDHLEFTESERQRINYLLKRDLPNHQDAYSKMLSCLNSGTGIYFLPESEYANKLELLNKLQLDNSIKSLYKALALASTDPSPAAHVASEDNLLTRIILKIKKDDVEK